MLLLLGWPPGFFEGGAVRRGIEEKEDEGLLGEGGARGQRNRAFLSLDSTIACGHRTRVLAECVEAVGVGVGCFWLLVFV